MIEKKLKKAADNIKMSDELKNRIAGQCRNIDAERSENEHVFTVETYKPRRISRFISGAAACAVIVGSVGTAGWLISRNSPMQSDELDADNTSFSDQQNAGAPFGDLTERQFYLSYQSDEIQKPSDEMKIKLADYFNEMPWEATETYVCSGEETTIDFGEETSVNYQELWKSLDFIRFTDERSNGWEGLYIYPENYVIYLSPDNVQTAYTIDFNELDSFLTEAINEEKARINGENYENISEKLADVEIQELIDACPFGDLTEYNIFKDLPLEKQKEVLYLFNTQKFEEVESTFSLVESDGILHDTYLAKGNEFWSLVIYRSGYMSFAYESDFNTGVTDVLKFYRIHDNDEFQQKLGSILYGDCLTGMDAPFANDDEVDWTCTEFASYGGGTLPQSTAKELRHAFIGEYWIKTDKDSITPATDNIVELTHDGKKLLIAYGDNYAIYNDGNSEQYYTIRGNAIENLLRVCIIFEIQSYPPIGNIYKMTQELYCESEAFTGDLTEQQIKNVSMAFYGKRWNEEQTDSFLYETDPDAKLMYKFTSPPDSKGHSEIWCVYEDYTIEFKSYTSNPYYDNSDDVYILRFRDTDVYGCYLLSGIEWAVTH